MIDVTQGYKSQLEYIQVWFHEKTGHYFIVDKDGTEVFGPLHSYEILHQYRYAMAPFEPTLAMPLFFETFKRKPNPYPISEYTKQEIAWLPPSVTHEKMFNGKYVDIDQLQEATEWQTTSAEKQVFEWLELANCPNPWIKKDEANFGMLTKKLDFHPKGSIIVCKNVRPGERVAILEWP